MVEKLDRQYKWISDNCQRNQWIILVSETKTETENEKEREKDRKGQRIRNGNNGAVDSTLTLDYMVLQSFVTLFVHVPNSCSREHARIESNGWFIGFECVTSICRWTCCMCLCRYNTNTHNHLSEWARVAWILSIPYVNVRFVVERERHICNMNLATRERKRASERDREKENDISNNLKWIWI